MDVEESSRLLKSATRASVAVAIVLVGAKLFAWLMTGSISVFASLLDSLMDTAASVINLFAVDYSLKPADADHRFGHGKAEALAGLGQAVFISFSALFLFYHAVERLLYPEDVGNLSGAIWVIVFAIVVTLALVAYQRFVVARTGSTAVAADSLHYLTDLITNVATLVALFLIQKGYLQADSIFGLLIGIFIFYSAVRVGWSAVRLLMDEELPDEERAQIIQCVESSPGVLSVRRMRSWRSGQRRVVHVDIVFAGLRKLTEVNRDVDAVVARLLQQDAQLDISVRPLPDASLE